MCGTTCVESTHRLSEIQMELGILCFTWQLCELPSLLLEPKMLFPCEILFLISVPCADRVRERMLCRLLPRTTHKKRCVVKSVFVKACLLGVFHMLTHTVTVQEPDKVGACPRLTRPLTGVLSFQSLLLTCDF